MEVVSAAKARRTAASYSALVLTGFFVFLFPDAKAQNWQQVAEIDSTPVYSILEHNGAFFAATADSIFKSPDGGNSWQAAAVPPGLTGELYRLFSYGAYLYIGTWDDGVFRTSDGGKSWQAYSTGLPAGAAIMGLAVLGDSIYAGTDGSGVYARGLSTPATWTDYNTGLFQLGVTTLGTSGENLVAGVGFYLFVRPRGGSQWANVDLDSLGSQRIIYEALPHGPHLFAGTNQGVYRGDLNGQNWKRTDIAGTPNRDIEALAADGGRLYAGVRFKLEHFIWYSDNFGQSWNIQAHEFSELFDLFSEPGRLWAARFDGLWHLEVATGVEEPSPRPKDFQLGQNYPNPFNPSTIISFTLPKSGPVELKIYDLLGREVRTLVDGFREAGSHAIKFDARDLPSGVYFYKIRAGEYQASRKMVLIK